MKSLDSIEIFDSVDEIDALMRNFSKNDDT